LLLSSAGRSVHSGRRFHFRFGDGVLEVEGEDLSVQSTGDSMRAAFRGVMGAPIRPSGSMLPRAPGTCPRYHAWIAQPDLPPRSGVLDYGRRLLEAGLPPGVVMIDAMWSRDYGNWAFGPSRFPDPAAMARTLHDWGCHLMLW